eukprot:Pgem_evm1s12170
MTVYKNKTGICVRQSPPYLNLMLFDFFELLKFCPNRNSNSNTSSNNNSCSDNELENIENNTLTESESEHQSDSETVN